MALLFLHSFGLTAADGVFGLLVTNSPSPCAILLHFFHAYYDNLFLPHVALGHF
jgi:hypothetical protein